MVCADSDFPDDIESEQAAEMPEILQGDDPYIGCVEPFKGKFLGYGGPAPEKEE